MKATITLDIDFTALAKQKRSLFPLNTVEADGLIALIDGIQDAAIASGLTKIDVYGYAYGIDWDKVEGELPDYYSSELVAISNCIQSYLEDGDEDKRDELIQHFGFGDISKLDEYLIERLEEVNKEIWRALP